MESISIRQCRKHLLNQSWQITRLPIQSVWIIWHKALSGWEAWPRKFNRWSGWCNRAESRAWVPCQTGTDHFLTCFLWWSLTQTLMQLNLLYCACNPIMWMGLMVNIRPQYTQLNILAWTLLYALTSDPTLSLNTGHLMSAVDCVL